MLKKLRYKAAQFIAGDYNSALTNKFNEAFFSYIGGHTVAYDWKSRETPIFEGYLKNPDVRAIVDQQATKTASIPVSIKKIKDEKKHYSLKQLRQATGYNLNPQQLIKHRLLETDSYDAGYLPMPIERPNPLNTWNELFRLFKIFLSLTGNVYYYKMQPEEGANAGVPQQLYTLPSHKMTIVLKKKADLLDPFESPIDRYMLIEGNQYIEFKEEEIIHIKLPNPNFDLSGSHLYGVGRLQSAFRNLESSNEAANLNVKTMKNGGAFGFVHAGDGATPLTPEQATDLKSRLIQMDKSTDRLARIAGSSAKVGFTRISLTTDELKPFEYLGWDRKVIANVLGWSDLLLNNDARGDYGGTISEMRKQVLMDNIIPDLQLFEEAFNKEFIQKFKGYENAVIEFDYSEMPEMQADVEKLSKWMFEGKKHGVFTGNQVLEALRYPKDEENEYMDQRLIAFKQHTYESSLIDGDFNQAFNNSDNDV